MYRSVGKLLERSCLFTSNECTSLLCNPTQYQTVRWRRKPRWLPTAPSKVFRVSPRTRLPQDEAEELKRLYNNYRTEMKSIRKYFREKLAASTTGPEVIAEQARLVEEEHLNCVQINEEWNRKVAQSREARIMREREQNAQTILEGLQALDLEEKRNKERMEAIVRAEKIKVKSYVTPETIDEAIDRALSTTSDYNFAIDLQQNIYPGRDSKIEASSSLEPSQTEPPLEPPVESSPRPSVPQ